MKDDEKLKQYRKGYKAGYQDGFKAGRQTVLENIGITIEERPKKPP